MCLLIPDFYLDSFLAGPVPTCVSGQLSGDTHVALTRLQAVYGADVVQASAGHIVPRGGIGARHHPGRTQWDGMHLRKRRLF